MPSTSTDEIPQRDWSYFFDVFSLRHRGWIASLELLDPEIGDQMEASHMRFEGVTYEASRHRPDAIELMFGGSPSDHVTHTIRGPRFVRLERTELENGTFETLEIECSRGPVALVRFHAGVTPEMETLDD